MGLQKSLSVLLGGDSVTMKIRLWLLLGLLTSGISWLYASRIFGPWEHYIAVESGKVKAQLGDLYSPWLGSRKLLLYGENPYSAKVSHEIQMGFYGRMIEQSYDQPGVAPIDEQRFAYPVYVAFLLSPIVRLDFEQPQRWAPAVLAVLTAASVLLWLSVLRWRLSATAKAALILFILSSPQTVQGLRLRQLGLLVAFMIALAAWFVTRNHLARAGVLLALSTIKPQMAILPATCFLLWALGDWRTRWRLLASFFGGLAILIVSGNLLLPGWLLYFVFGLRAYSRYALTTSVVRLILGNALGLLVSVISAFALLAFLWRQRKCSADSRNFAVSLATTLLITTIALPLMPPFNQTLLILPLLMVLRDWQRFGRPARVAFFCFAAWPWITSLILLLASPPVRSTNRLALLPSFPAVCMPFVLLPMIASYCSELLSQRNWPDEATLNSNPK